MSAVGLFRLQILRERALAGCGRTQWAAHSLLIPEKDVEQRERVADSLKRWRAVDPVVRRTILALVWFEAWILFVIVISLGGLGHVPALVWWRWSAVALWGVTIITAAVRGGALFVWLDVKRLLRRSPLTTQKQTP